jgi:isopentenyldiphosphate isomerase
MNTTASHKLGLRSRLLRAIRRCSLDLGYPPSLRDLEAVLGFYPHYQLDKAREAGDVEWEQTTARCVRLTAKGRAAIGVVTLADFGPDPVVRLYGKGVRVAVD